MSPAHLSLSSTNFTGLKEESHTESVVEEHTTKPKVAAEVLDGQLEGGGTASLDFAGSLELTILFFFDRIVSSKGPTKSNEEVPPPSGCPSKPSVAASSVVVCSSTANSLWDSSFQSRKICGK
jgi:hypothetical protein